MAKDKTAQTKPKKRRWKRDLATIFLFALIFYVGAHVISRTEGVRMTVADKLSNATRQQISLEKCGMTPLMGLRLQRLSFQGVEMPDVKISFNWLSFLSKEKPFVKQLRIKELDVRFCRIPDSGCWDPLVLNGVGSRLGSVLGLTPGQAVDDKTIPKFPAYAINEKTLLQLDRAKVVWRDESGREVAYITDADLKLKVSPFIRRKVVQTIAKCGHVKLASGRALRDFRLEVFRIEGSKTATVLNMADSNGEYEEFASQTLWQDLNMHLNQLAEIR
ncbi:MAG TPA: hypothetical protein VIR63_06520 [Pontiella sp.]